MSMQGADDMSSSTVTLRRDSGPPAAADDLTNVVVTPVRVLGGSPISEAGMSDVCDIGGPHFGSGLAIDTAAEL
jgi:hypothetical protein